MAIYSPIEERLINLEKNGVPNGNGAGGGDVKIIKTTDWALVNGEYQYTFKHTLNTENLTVEMIDVATKESMQPIYKIIDNANILIKSITNKEIKVVLISFSGGINAKDEVIASRTDKITGKIYDNLGARMDSTSASLAEKAQEINSVKSSKMDKDTTNISISQINKNLGKIDQSFIADSLLQQMAGTTSINTTPPLRGITTEKIASKSVTPSETNFFADIINIFNKDSATEGYALNRSTGATTIASTWFVSDYILISPSTDYKCNKYADWCAYDVDKKFIAGSGLTFNANNPYVTPSNACYIRIGISGLQNKTSTMVCLNIQDNSTYVAYNKTNLKNEYLNIDFINDNIKLKNKSVNEYNTTFMGNCLNIFDYTKAVLGQGLNTENGNLLSGDSYANNYVSDFIEIKDYVTTIYTNPKFYKFICFYNEKKVFLSKGTDGEGDKNTTIQVPIGAKYLRIGGVDKTNVGSQYVGENERPPYKLPYGTIYIKNEKINKLDLNGFKGKKLTAFGHSVVAMNRWQPYLEKELGVILTNCGVGGSSVSGTDGTTGNKPMWTDDRINAIPQDSDYILILAGINDQKGTDNLGVITSKNTETYYGAYQVMLDKIYARCPNARIVIMTDIHRNVEDWGIHYAEAYRQATRDVAYKYGYPVIEMKQLCGFNKLNEDVFYSDGVHPNDIGGKRMAEVVIGFLKSIMPIN